MGSLRYEIAEPSGSHPVDSAISRQMATAAGIRHGNSGRAWEPAPYERRRRRFAEAAGVCHGDGGRTQEGVPRPTRAGHAPPHQPGMGPRYADRNGRGRFVSERESQPALRLPYRYRPPPQRAGIGSLPLQGMTDHCHFRPVLSIRSFGPLGPCRRRRRQRWASVTAMAGGPRAARAAKNRRNPGTPKPRHPHPARPMVSRHSLESARACCRTRAFRLE